MLGQNHLTESLFYNKGLCISCDLLNPVLKVKNRVVVWIQNGINVRSLPLHSIRRQYHATHSWPGKRSQQKFKVWCLLNVYYFCNIVEDAVGKGMAACSSICTWRTPWAEEPGRLYSPWCCKEWTGLSH